MGGAGAFGAGQAKFHGQLLMGFATDVLLVEQALQVGIVATVFALDHPFRRVDLAFVQLGVDQAGEQQVEYRALIPGRRLDDEAGIAVAGIGVPLAAKGLHADFQAGFAAGVDAAEQQVFEQVREFLVGAGEVVEAHAHHQADRHMATFGSGFEQQLQAVFQWVALDLQTVFGVDGVSHEQAKKQQGPHECLPDGHGPSIPVLERCRDWPC
ncbi:hypothetical protein D9M68_619000 [compost metagenome]